MKRVMTLLLLAACAQAQAAEPEPRCDDGEYHSQAFQNDCAWTAWQLADKELNRVYQQVMKALPSDRRAQLRTEQRAWLKKLQPDCEEPLGPPELAGSMWRMELGSCMAAETRKRTLAIRHWPGTKD